MKQIEVKFDEILVRFVQPELIYRKEQIINVLLDFTGRKNSEELATAIVEMEANNEEFYAEIGDTKYCITILNEKPVFEKVTLHKTEQLLAQKNFSTSEIKEVIETLYESKIVNTLQLNIGNIKIEKGLRYLDQSPSQLQEKLVDQFGRRKCNTILEDIEGLIQQSNVIIAKYKTKKYLLKISDNIPTWKEFEGTVEDEALREFFLNTGFSQKEYEYFVKEKPNWIPTGFSHVEGNLNTGYVVRDDNGNEFVYLPEYDIYVSRYEISKTSSGRYVSIPNANSHLISRYNRPENKAYDVAASFQNFDFENVDDNKVSKNYLVRPLESYSSIVKTINDKIEDGMIFQKDSPYNISLKNCHLLFTKDEEPINDPNDGAYGSHYMSHFQGKLTFQNGIAGYDRKGMEGECAIRLQLNRTEKDKFKFLKSDQSVESD